MLRVKIIALIMLTLVGSSGVAHATSATADTSAEAQCKGLPSPDFFGIQDAPAQVTATKVLEPAAGAPAYCRVQGYVSPQVGFEFRLPLSHWNGKFMEVGGHDYTMCEATLCVDATSCSGACRTCEDMRAPVH